MDVRQLQYFLRIVDNGSVHRAAESLFVAQPSVSQGLRALERDLGTQLFHRTGRHLVLTAAGETLIEPAREVIRWMELARTVVDATDGLHVGRLVVASMPSQAASPLAGLIAAFARRHPGVEVSVRAAATPDDVVDILRTGEAELGVIASPGSPIVRDRLVVHPLETQPFVLVARDESELSGGSGPVRPGDLPGVRLIVGQRGTGMRRAADAILAASPGSRIGVEIEHREALLPLVLSGAGVAVVAESWEGLAESAGLTVRPLDGADELHVVLAHRSARLSPAAEAFLAVAVPADSSEAGMSQF
ncbi:MAG: LysR family transcriptional regulator [Nocardioidaceae bacterium]